ncbi:MAG TPA: ABC transporter ATP-binding protein [Nitriliruptorales bacterium]|nr:ABC transporter ATP-binding protein [Nitriliruptorales bacterium]
MPVLEARDLSIRFGGVQALDGVDFQVEESEIVGLIGPNGAGKTTFFHCVTGFHRPDTGRVLIHGDDVTDLRPDQRTHLGVARSFQQVGLVRSFTVLENLLVAQHRKVRYHTLAGLVASPASLAEERVLQRRALEVLDFIGLAHLADSGLAGLPYGTLKMVEVAAVLCTDPDVLMLDEPMAGLAPEEAEAFGDRLLEMRRELGLTIVVVDHHVPLVLHVADYVYVLNFGRMLAHGPPDRVRGDRAVAEAYMGEGVSALA